MLVLWSVLPPAHACGLALVLAIDTSSSIDSREFILQRDGLANALRDETVVAALGAVPGGATVLAFEWSGQQSQAIMADWTRLDDPGAVMRFAERISAHKRARDDMPTALGRALGFAAHKFRDAPDCARRVIDVSGDGANNEGVDPSFYRRRGALDGITVNGLVIGAAHPDPAAYYRAEVLQGPGAFLMRAGDFAAFGATMRAKLLREISGAGLIGWR